MARSHVGSGRLAALMTALLVCGGLREAAGSRGEGDSRAEFAAVDSQTYEALEAAPVRGWGDQTTLRALNDLRHELRHTPGGGDAEKRVLRLLPAKWGTILEGFLKRLRLSPAATLLLDEQGHPRGDPPRAKLTVHADVPGALVLRVLPGPAKGKLAISPVRAPGLRVEGRELELSPSLPQVAVLPVLATGKAGRRDVELKGTAGGKPFSLAMVLDVRASGRLAGTVARRGGGEPLAAKLFVEDQAGRLYVVPGERNWRTQSWYAPWQPRFSYVQGAFELPLPPGRYRVTAMKGPGWANWEGSVDIEPGRAARCRIEMRPLRTLEWAGWFCGDMHIHYRGGPTLRQMRAEDVHVAANTLYSSHKSIPMPRYRGHCDAMHLSTSNQEIEHWIFGNTFYFHIPTTVLDPPAGRREHTPMFHYDEQAHRMGGITMRWLRGRAFRVDHGQAQPELAVSAALGHMDVWSVLDNSMQNLLDSPARRWTGDGWGGRLYENTYRTWYALLNCGLRVPGAAGTSYGRLSRLGFNRVYAKVDGKLTNASWAAALKRGDGFVTNGPLLWLRAGEAGKEPGGLPGDGIALETPGKVSFAVRLRSQYRVRLIELLHNGRAIARKDVDGVGADLTWQVVVDVKGPSWFAARCFGEHRPRYPHAAAHNQFAHTNPLYVTVAGRGSRSAADARRFVREIDALIAFAPKALAEPMRSRALAQYRKARAYFASQTDE